MPQGKIIKALSGFYYVQNDTGIYMCKARGKFRNSDLKPLVGDNVDFQIENLTEGYILNIYPRSNSLIRPNVSNVDQAVIVVSAKEPDFSTLLLDKFLLLVEHMNIKPIICITKMDLVSSDDPIFQYIQDYKNAGYHVYPVSNDIDGINSIKGVFKNKQSVITGQSGVGKSTLLNTLNNQLHLQTNDISKALGRGKHTTRHVELVEIEEGLVADTPGFSSLELDMTLNEIANAYHDFNELSKMCKFRGCLHDSEPGCKVKEAVQHGFITTYRYEHYKMFLQELKNKKEKY